MIFDLYFRFVRIEKIRGVHLSSSDNDSFSSHWTVHIAGSFKLINTCFLFKISLSFHSGNTAKSVITLKFQAVDKCTIVLTTKTIAYDS